MPAPVDVGFTGSRLGARTREQEQALGDALAREFGASPSAALRHGVCVGGDALAHRVVRRLLPSARIVGHPPIDRTLVDKAALQDCDSIVPDEAYLARNRSIVNASGVLVAMPATMREEDRGGTWYTIRFARRVGRRILIVWPDGRTDEEQGRKRNFLTLSNNRRPH